MALTTKQTRYLRSLAHHLEPLVQTGKDGVTTAVIAAVAQGLAAHELIKVRIGVADRQERQRLAEGLGQSTNAELVQVIGRLALLYKAATEPTIKLP